MCAEELTEVLGHLGEPVCWVCERRGDKTLARLAVTPDGEYWRDYCAEHDPEGEL
jgi:hypothetical protein